LVPPKKELCVGKTKRDKGSKLIALADGHGLPLAVCAESASAADVRLVNRTLEERFVANAPEKLKTAEPCASNGYGKSNACLLGWTVLYPWI
jgi:hypothetical protein